MKTKLLIIGAGPGGYTAAFLAADLGMDVTLVDKAINPGGTCLYCGCIPYKSLLHCSKILNTAKESSEIGISFSDPTINLEKINSWKNGVIEKLTGGLGQLVKARKINYIQGTASFVDEKTASISHADNTSQTITFENAIIATGSSPISINSFPQSDKILNSKDSVDLKYIPKSILIVGGGVIGLEAATIYSALGSEVSVVEMMPSILPGTDKDLSNILNRKLKNTLKSIFISTQVTEILETSSGLSVTFKDKKEKSWTEEYENVLVSVGRKPNTNDINLHEINITTSEKGFIETNDKLQTSHPHIYAIGDVIGQPMLAHKASHEGKVAVENIASQNNKTSSAIPAVVYTDPEIATCGLTEAEAKENSMNVAILKFPWAASGRALTTNKPDGVTKLIVDKDTKKVLGAGIVGEHAGELIAECGLAINKGLTVNDIKTTIHPHPTLSETIMETAEIFFGQATHIFRPNKSEQTQ